MTETPFTPNPTDSFFVRVDATYADGTVVHGVGAWTGITEIVTAADLLWRNGVAATSVSVNPMIGNNPNAVLPVNNWHYFQVGSLDAIGTQADFAMLNVSRTASFGLSHESETLDLFPNNIAGNQVSLVGFPASTGGSTPTSQMLTVALDPNTWTFNHSGPTVDPGYAGSYLLYSFAANGPGNLGRLTAGVATSAGTLAALSPAIQQIINGWVNSDNAAGPAQPIPGGVGVAVPALIHSIAQDTNAVGVNPAEAALVDAFSYAVKNPDVIAAGMDPAVHFALYGWHENRAPDPLFDVNYYLAHNPDVAASGMDPLLHYAMYGWKEGRDPSAAFSTKTYLADNADVKAAGIDPLQHYLYYGINEFRAGGQVS